MDALFLLMFTIVLNFVPHCLKLLTFAFLFETLRNIPVFTAVFSHKSCPSARYASAANTVCKANYKFREHKVPFDQILK
jgi:hypothetical protein